MVLNIVQKWFNVDAFYGELPTSFVKHNSYAFY